MYRIHERLRRMETRRPALPPVASGWTLEQQRVLQTDPVARDLNDQADQQWRAACVRFDTSQPDIDCEESTYHEAVLRFLPDEDLRDLSDAYHALHDRLEGRA